MKRFKGRLRAVYVGLGLSVVGWGGWRGLDVCSAAQGERPPTLDELLNTPQGEKVGVPMPEAEQGPDGSPPPSDGSTDAVEEEMDLPERVDSSDVFDRVVDQMSRVSDRLGQAHDPGIRTQRIQAQVLALLDQVIEQARRQGSSTQTAAAGSSKGQAGRQESGSAANAPRPGGIGGGPDDQSSPSVGQSPGGGPAGHQDAADQEDGPLHEGRSEWGHLPPRLRDELQQGYQEPYSSAYRQLTEQYYRRLAEEGD